MPASVAFTLTAIACTTCDDQLRALLFDGRFPLRLLAISLPLLIGGFATAALVRRLAGPVAGAGMLLGLGMGGFIDGILLHQLLQWHQMVSAVVEPTTVQLKNVNMFWDGMFHVGCWVLTAAGLGALWRTVGRTDVVRSTAVLLGAMLLGWGVFNLIDSVFNHYVFGYHNVREWTARPWAWNLGFLLLGLAQAAAGALIVARPTRPPPPRAQANPPEDPSGILGTGMPESRRA